MPLAAPALLVALACDRASLVLAFASRPAVALLAKVAWRLACSFLALACSARVPTLPPLGPRRPAPAGLLVAAGLAAGFPPPPFEPLPPPPPPPEANLPLASRL